ncbi:MAG TPA: T9SS type A sorting domain-containing protein [Arachidicoccus sp.]|nr:T9SS type A sorting domain-containing protein [Arachidicoccus sp.]
MDTKILRKVLLSAALGFAVGNTDAQSPGGITTNPAVWYRPENATSVLWKDATPNVLDLNVATNGTITVNPGDAKHNFQPWTSGYSASNFYRYDGATNPVFGKWGDGGITTTASTDYASGFYYMPITIFGAARPTSAANGEITGIDDENTNGAEPGLGLLTSGGKVYPRLYRAGNGIDNTALTMSAAIGQTSVFMSHPFPGSSTATGTGDLIIGLNGKDTTIANTNPRSSVAGTSFKIGYSGWAFGAFPGDIQEVVWYKASLTASESQKVNTYLALKYGTTLAQNYVNAAGNTIYDLSTNAGYVNNIAGIGAESANGSLDQRQSNSVNIGKQVVISTTGLNNTNATNTVSLSEGQYLVWGDNGLDKMPTVPVANVPGTNYRFAAVWKVQNTSAVNTVRVAWPQNTNFGALKLVQSSDPSFATVTATTDMTTTTQVVNGVTYNYADVVLTDGQYFTFTAKVFAPGGIAALPAVWYQPNNASAAHWTDASINELYLTNEAGTATVNAGDQMHNFHKWTTDYSTTSYYNFLDSNATNTDLEDNPVFGNWNVNSYSYMPITIFGAARQTATGNGLITGIDNDKPYGAETSLGNNGLSPRFYRFANGNDKTATTLTATLGKTSLYYAHPNPGALGAPAGDLVVGLDGYDTTFTNLPGVSSLAGPYLKIGYDGFTFGAFKGDIQEVIWYKASLTAAEKLQVDTYLALKYGTTLAHNYVDAAGNTIYDISVDEDYFSHNIAGIGKEENNGNLNQRQSNSVNTGKQLLISTAGLANTNEANTSSLAEGQYLIWGDNGLAKAPSIYTGNTFTNQNVRFKAIWRVQNTAGVGTIRLAWPAGLSNLALIQSTDTTFNASDVITAMTGTQVVNGITYNYVDVTLNNGEYFTFAAKIEHAPGGVFSGLSQWYRADKQTAVVGGGDTTLTTWTDFASGVEATQIATQAMPKLHTGSNTYFNFNPGINFTDGDQTLGNMSTQPITDTAYDIFTITKEGLTAGGAYARIYSVLANKTLTSGSLRYWDGIGINYDGNVERYNSTTGLAYFANPGGINFATNSPSIMYHKFNYNYVSKGLNGATNGTAAQSGPYQVVDGGFVFGSTVFSGNGADNRSFKGDLGETIIYGAGNITPEERNRVDAYLAIKYGVTLDKAESYLTSASSVVWDKDADNGFYNNVAGIGRDDLSDLYQKQSRSQITNNANDQLTVGLGDILATNNDNTQTLNNGQFLVWGDNGKTEAMNNVATTYTLLTYNASDVRRMNRIWKARATNAVASVKLRFPVASVGTTTFPVDGTSQYVIIFASDSAMTGNITVSPLTANGSVYDVMHSFPVGASYFSFGKIQTGIALPIDLAKDFAAKTIGTTVVLDWTTASEHNNKGFQVERSADGQKWDNLTFVNSKAEGGNSQKPISYSYTDLSPLVNTNNMYRLKQVDNSGASAYSRVVTIATGSNQSITIYPNPAHNTLNISNLGNGVKTVRIVSVDGNSVYNRKISSDKVAVDVQSWSAGIYLVSVTSAKGQTLTFKAIVK